MREPPYDGDEEHEDPDFDWTDVLAFTIAAYQVLLPFLLALLGVIGLIYFVIWLLAQ